MCVRVREFGYECVSATIRVSSQELSEARKRPRGMREQDPKREGESGRAERERERRCERGAGVRRAHTEMLGQTYRLVGRHGVCRFDGVGLATASTVPTSGARRGASVAARTTVRAGSRRAVLGDQFDGVRSQSTWHGKQHRDGFRNLPGQFTRT